VRTWQGAEVIVPNSSLIADRVINWTLSDRNRRIDVSVGVAYGTDPKRVIDLLLAVASAHPDVLDRPEPTAFFTGFGDSSLDFEVRAWTGRAEIYLQVKSDIAVGIHAALAEAGITVPFPQRDLHLQSVDAGVARVLRGGDPGEETGTA
jgi:potassium efflux system protein